MKSDTYYMTMLYDFYGNLLTDKQKDLFDLYYNEDLSLSEIADNEGITRQGVRDSIKRAEAQLLDMEQRLGLAKRFREMRSGLEQIREAAQRIQDYNKHYVYSRDLSEDTQTIIDLAQKLCE